MSASARADQLRQRAQQLRLLATRIESSLVMRLERFAGEDTWRGPRPALHLATLISNQHQLHHAAEDLRRQAYQLARDAEMLEVLEVLARVPGELAG